MHRYLFLFRVLLIFIFTVAAPLCSWTMPASRIDSVLNVLDKEIANKGDYAQAKEHKISDIKSGLKHCGPDNTKRFAIYKALYDEYNNYQFDSAYVYANRMLKLASQPEMEGKLPIAQVALMECYTSVGFFKEAAEIHAKIIPTDIPNDMLVPYYQLCSRLYHNLASFVEGPSELGKAYDRKCREYSDSVLTIAPKNSYEYDYSELDRIQTGVPVDEPILETRKRLVAKHERAMSDHERAINYSLIGQASIMLGKDDDAVYFMALSAIYDLRSNTRETTAAKDLASYLFLRGDIQRADKYIHLALDDALFYNSRLRKFEINSILPRIETARYDWLNYQRWALVAIAATITALLVLSLVLFFKLKKRNHILTTLHKELHDKNEALQEANGNLQRLNQNLKEANEIKDEYIISALVSSNTFIDEVEEKCRIAIRLLKEKNVKELNLLLYDMGLKKEYQRMFSTFDNAFLKLFPNFINEFNKLLLEEHRLPATKQMKEMPMDIRIFALMRLGIKAPNDIANYLKISVNTVYVYKTKMKSKACVAKADFDRLVMEIPKP